MSQDEVPGLGGEGNVPSAEALENSAPSGPPTASSSPDAASPNSVWVWLQELLDTGNEVQLREAVATATEHWGENNLHTLHVISYLVAKLVDNEKFAEALPLAERELMYKQRLGDLEDEELPGTYRNLGLCLQGLGRHEEAERHFVQALDLTQRSKGHEHPRTIDRCDDLALCWMRMRKHAEAVRMFRRVVAFNTRLKGEESNATMCSTMNLVKCLVEMGKFKASVPLLRRALELSSRARGSQDDLTINIMLSLGGVLLKTRDYEGAERMLRPGVALSTRVHGEGHYLTLEGMWGLTRAVTSGDTSRLPEGLALGRHALEVFRRVLGEEHCDTLQVTCDLLEILVCLGMHAEGGPMARSTLDVCIRALGRDHPHTAHATIIAMGMNVLIKDDQRRQRARQGRAGRR